MRPRVRAAAGARVVPTGRVGADDEHRTLSRAPLLASHTTHYNLLYPPRIMASVKLGTLIIRVRARPTPSATSRALTRPMRP
jgi:hypothetical protein